MINPFNSVSAFIKDTPVDSNLFKYGKFIPVVGVILQIAKHFSLRNEIYAIPLKTGNDVNDNENFKLAQRKLNDMTKLDGMTQKNLIFTNGFVFAIIVSKAIFSTVLLPMVIALPLLIISHSITLVSQYYVRRYLEENRPSSESVLRFNLAHQTTILNQE